MGKGLTHGSDGNDATHFEYEIFLASFETVLDLDDKFVFDSNGRLGSRQSTWTDCIIIWDAADSSIGPFLSSFETCEGLGEECSTFESEWWKSSATEIRLVEKIF